MALSLLLSIVDILEGKSHEHSAIGTGCLIGGSPEMEKESFMKSKPYGCRSCYQRKMDLRLCRVRDTGKTCMVLSVCPGHNRQA